ncbi:unnamed protein product [Pleuronectes platessa]|uniref:Uncharacterized protein n=1 Tax=Pleuronectes platessa TaxID=8262 RepID=A0A9N7UEB8_PLEPL|nr:unnamed protein product [Pleuronectes platessa]
MDMENINQQKRGLAKAEHMHTDTQAERPGHEGLASLSPAGDGSSSSAGIGRMCECCRAAVGVLALYVHNLSLSISSWPSVPLLLFFSSFASSLCYSQSTPLNMPVASSLFPLVLCLPLSLAAD